MKMIKFIRSIFEREEKDYPLESVAMALNDSSVRVHWLKWIAQEIREIGYSIDSDLLQKKEQDIKAKSLKRIVLQEVLDQVLRSKSVVERGPLHNPVFPGVMSTLLDKRRS